MANLKTRFKLFYMGALQVFSIVTNTWLIANDYMGYALIAQFFITYIWTFNVKSIAISSNGDRVAHALGAMFGSALVYILTLLIK